MRYRREYISRPSDCMYRVHKCYFERTMEYPVWFYSCSISGNTCPDGRIFPTHCKLEDDKS